jgi:nucleoside-diphosphate-sugar epimerase
VGAVFLQRLLAAGHTVRALYRPRANRVLPDPPGLTWIPGDLADPSALASLVKSVGAVVHCAGAVRGATRRDFDAVNEDGVLAVLRAAVGEAGCQRFLLVSSLAAREPGLSHYAGSKRRGERVLATHAGRLGWTILRPPAVYGPGDREMLPLFRSMARGVAPIPGNGQGRFSMMYVDDLASAVLAWLAVESDAGQTFELDDGRAGGYDWNTVRDIASRVLRNQAPVRPLLIPAAVLRIAGAANLAAAKLFSYAPMLTPGKVRELTHADWVSRGSEFLKLTAWRPAVGLERGLACTFGHTPAAVHGVN